MARGPKLHLKRLFAPKDWMLSKLTGVYAPRPSAGPHKLRECLPLLIILRNRLKYALTGAEASMILRQRLVNVDNKARTDPKYPAGFMDVIEIPKTGEAFRVMYDVKGRFTLIKIKDQEADIKLCKVTNVWTTTGRVPVVTTHDGKRIRYPDPKLNIGDSFVYNLKTNKIGQIYKFKAGRIAMLTGGANRGRIGEVVNIERHPGAFDIAHLKDSNGLEFATRSRNVFILADKHDAIAVTIPKAQGLKKDIQEERLEKLATAENKKQALLKAHKKGGKKQ
jgi:small subunit ribosomal protein S4e